ncbi:MAG: 5-nucleotidase / UDP-sugar diphosphatase [Acidobacteriota bacterium]|nr:5-nucleotidase / UDP-sugar diphosphatase [Acidobacteriota bacterium]
MKKQIIKSSGALVLFMVLLLLLQGYGIHAADTSRNTKPFALTIAHFNDSHANLEPSPLTLNINGTKTYTTIGGFPAVTAKVLQLRQTKKNFLFLHAGDVFQGSLYFTKYRGMADLEFLKLMKLDAMCTGNHEFDKGPVALAIFISGAHKQFPVLAANISAEKDRFLAGKLKPYEIKKFGSRKVGIIGITTTETPAVSSPGQKLVFNDPIPVVKTLVAELTRKGVDIIIVLSHEGFQCDIQLAKTVEGVDVIVGGHTHTLLGRFETIPDLSPEAEYPYVVKNPQQDNVLIVQAWEKDKILGVLDVEFDNTGKVVNYSGQPVILTGNKPTDFLQKNADDQKEPVNAETFKAIADFIEKDPALEMKTENKQAEALLAKFSAPIRELKQAIIGHGKEDLWNVRQPGDKHETAGVLKDGSMIAPVVADALLWKAKSLKNKNTQIVIQNAGGVRGDLPAGDITIGQVYELLPFANTLVLLDLDGASLKQVLKATILKSDGAFPYPAGLRYAVDLNKTDNDFFLTVQVETNNDWVDIKDEEIYHIAINRFIASGKDGYTVIGNAKDKDDTGFGDAEIFMEYLKESRALTAQKSRVKVIRN